jgi:hypothetical protein
MDGWKYKMFVFPTRVWDWESETKGKKRHQSCLIIHPVFESPTDELRLTEGIKRFQNI